MDTYLHHNDEEGQNHGALHRVRIVLLLLYFFRGLPGPFQQTWLLGSHSQNRLCTAEVACLEE